MSYQSGLDPVQILTLSTMYANISEPDFMISVVSNVSYPNLRMASPLYRMHAVSMTSQLWISFLNRELR